MKNVAIACQGGGSHTAFTAGALQRFVPAIDADPDHRLVGLSGTSGGAVTATAAWYGLLSGGTEGAVERVEAVWADITADSVAERAVNRWTVTGSRVANSGLGLPEFSPYVTPGSMWSQRTFRRTLERHIDFDAFDELVAANPDGPSLFVGTVDINGGRFECFRDEDITVDALLASAAIPELFRAVAMNGHWHWDGLFSQNPPVQDLMHVDAERKPHELWVLQINPQEREGEPKSLLDITDRRNELAGNLSLNQELRFIETVNGWVEAGHLPSDEFHHTCVDRIELDERLGYSSKLDRTPEFIERLLQKGRKAAEAHLADHGIG